MSGKSRHEATFQVGRRSLNARRLDHVERILLAVEDITDREQHQEDLRQSDERYRTLFESLDQGFCIIEVLFDEDDKPVDYVFLETNPAFERHTGLDQAVGQRMRALEPNHEEHWFETYGHIARTGEGTRFTNRAQPLNDRWFEVNAFRVGQAAERKVAILFSDITERKQGEEALR